MIRYVECFTLRTLSNLYIAIQKEMHRSAAIWSATSKMKCTKIQNIAIFGQFSLQEANPDNCLARLYHNLFD